MKTVLAIDGGGVRGILPAMILAEIEHRTGKPARDLFDVIAGTSTGAFIAALATCNDGGAAPLSAQQIVDLYRSDAKRYFKRSSFGWFAPRYDSRSVVAVLRERLGATTLAETATSLIIPVFALREGVPRVHYFNTLTAKQLATDNHLLWQVVRGATAAPAFFSPFTVESLDGSIETAVIDGGVFANNPAMLGWLHAHQTLSSVFKSKKKGQVFALNEQFDTAADKLAATIVISIGTGFANSPVDPRKAAGWGKVQWLRPMFDVMFEGQSAQVTAELAIAKKGELLHYFERLQPELSEEIGLDDVDKLAELEDAARQYLEADKKDKKLVDQVCQQLCAVKPCDPPHQAPGRP
ncbi:MAG: patatin-like phospholipase family protein [Woeseia sp.]